jgi:ABC-type transporter Mla subunit MlaD
MHGPQKRISPQKRLSENLNRARVELEVKRAVQPLAVLLIGVAIGLGGFYYIYDHIGAGGGAKQTVKFAADDTTGLVPDRAEVRFKGIAAGIITDVKIEDGKAVVTASVLKKWGPIYKDARAVIRPNTPLQDMYLDIVDRGHKAAGPAGKHNVMPASQTDTSVNISDVLQTFEPDVRDRMRTLMTELGQGLDDRGAKLREAFVELTPFIDIVGNLSRQLTVRTDRTKRMVHNVGQLTKVLGERDTTLRKVVDDGSRLLSATADQRTGLDGMLRELPPALHELDTSFATLRGVLPAVDTAVDRLQPVADRLPSGLASIKGLSGDARPAVRALREPLTALVPLSKSLKPLSQSLSGSVTALRPQLPDVALATKDVAGCPVAAYMFFQWTASITKFDDAMGAYPTGDFGFGADSLSGVKSPGRSASPSCARGGPKGSEP